MRSYKRRKNTSWQGVDKWYSNKVGDKGHYFQENVIFPRLKEIMDISVSSSILDLGCGEGVLSRELSGYGYYLGLDLSKGLIEQAKKKNRNDNCDFDVKDVSRSLDLGEEQFTHATIVLALQNIENYDGVLENASKYLGSKGLLYIVLNHPHFRIPKSTSWEIDPQTRHQYRRVFRYLSEHKIRIDMNPGDKSKNAVTYSFHRSLQDYSNVLEDKHFAIKSIYEWTSNKVSEGGSAEMENFARNEIPMFMCIVAQKLN